MGRKPLPIEKLRAEMKFGAPRHVLEALSKEADAEGITRKKLAEQVVTEHVAKWEKKIASKARKIAAKPVKPASRARRRGMIGT